MVVRQINAPNGRTVELRLRPNRAARRLSLRVSAIDGRATLTYPRGIAGRELDGFINRHRDWLLNSQPAECGELVAPGTLLPVEGVPRRIGLLAPGAAPALMPDALHLAARAPSDLPAAVERWLKARARQRICDDVAEFARRAGRKPGRLTLRDTRARWGSCSANGNLMLSWRLIMAPPAVRRYVAAHEVAHLTHMNHGPGFWDHVGDLMPDYAHHRAWLRENGRDLHRYRFG